MALNIYNSLTHKKEEFIPLNGNNVGLYSCGPTVYNYPHIGNYRAYIFSDILKRYLRYRGYNVLHVMNITDVDDKTIRRSQIVKKSLKEFTEFYTEIFFHDRDLLNIVPADIYTKATDYIHEMLNIIETLIEKGYAYQTPEGSVYFDIRKDKEYGKLSHFNISDLKENAKGRLSKDEYDKENAEDFALWKAWDENDGDVFWDPKVILGHDTDIGKGRPGWHIECSAMSMSKLGESFDIHTGGVDNMFPHHENEIAQSECSTGKIFSKYFMHNEHLFVDGHKMSKSLGNYYTLEDLVKKGINPIVFRFWLYASHYATKANFTFESLDSIQTAFNRLQIAFVNLGDKIGQIDKNYKDLFIESMDDDLNTAKALAVVWDLLRDKDIPNENKKATILDFDKVFGFRLDQIKEDIIPSEIVDLAITRQKVRINKDWGKSDEIRDTINKLGYDIKDIEDNRYKISKIK